MGTEKGTNRGKKMGSLGKKPKTDLRVVTTKYDWEKLGQEWRQSGVSKTEFLRSRNIDPNSGNARRQSSKWTKNDEEITEVIEKAKKLKDSHKKKLNQKQLQEFWTLIEGFRADQATSDYKLAETIRAHLRMKLRDGLAFKKEKGKEVPISKLSHQQLSTYLLCLERAQRVQRLALGLTVGDTGIDEKALDEDNTPQVDQEEFENIYVCEVSKDGKFKRPRPRKLK